MSFFMNSRSAAPYGTGDIGKPILDSGANFTSWLRTIKAIARAQRLWPFLSGEEVLVNKPDLEEYLKDNGKGWEEYCGAREDYKNQQQKVRDAWWLLHNSVSPLIRRGFSDIDNPSDALTAIKADYQPPQYRAQLQAFTHIETVRLTCGKSMSQFIAELRDCRLDITDTQGTISDVFMIGKISRSLPEDYDDFIYTNILIVKECPALEEIFHKLLRLEGDMLVMAQARNRTANTTPNQTRSHHRNDNSGRRRGRGGRNNTGTNRHGTNNNNTRSSDKVCDGCKEIGRRGIGHTYSKCWTTNPEIRARITETASKVKNENSPVGAKKLYSLGVYAVR